MQRIICGTVAVCAWLGIGGAHAQQPGIQWKQTINVPKGLNLPKDIKVDILGIELGDTYDEVKAKLERLLAESASPKQKEPPAAQPAPKAPPSAAGSSLIAPSINIAQMDAHRLGTMANKEREIQDQLSGASSAPPLNESKVEMYLRVNNDRIVVSYVDGFALARDLPGNSGQKYSDEVRVKLSAPSSGRQTIGIYRFLSYPNQSDQPRISELIGRLSEKLKAKPQVFPMAASGALYRFQFDDGRIVVPPNANDQTCTPRYAQAVAKDTAQQSNLTGQCDVVMEVEVKYGMSTDHAYAVRFTLSDNERTKLDVVADFTFFENYARDLQSRSQGVAPKL